MTRQCAWCGLILGRSQPLRDRRITHGICPSCLEMIQHRICQSCAEQTRFESSSEGAQVNACVFVDDLADLEIDALFAIKK